MPTPKMTSKLRSKRLLLLAEHLSKPLPWRFNMKVWGRHADPTHKPTAKNYCGTAACALGSAALMPAFCRAGLKSKWVKDTWAGGWRLKITMNHLYETAAGAEFFGLTSQEARALFRDTLQTRRQVIQHLRYLAKFPYQPPITTQHGAA